MAIYNTRDLANLLEVDPKTLRSYLRKHYKHESGTTWRISTKQLEELTQHFNGTGDSPELYADRQEKPKPSRSVERVKKAVSAAEKPAPFYRGENDEVPF